MINNYRLTLRLMLRLAAADPRLVGEAWSIHRGGKTFLTLPKLLSLADGFQRLTRRSHKPVHIAEFGVGRGGSAILLARLLKRHSGSLTLFDVFGRIPPPTAADGKDAEYRYQKILTGESENYYGNIPELQGLIHLDLLESEAAEGVIFVPGRYEETLPTFAAEEPFDLVHIDCDWYESTRCVLGFLEKNLQTGAILQIDDYFYWQGAQQAVDEAAWLGAYRRRRVDSALVIDTG